MAKHNVMNEQGSLLHFVRQSLPDLLEDPKYSAENGELLLSPSGKGLLASYSNYIPRKEVESFILEYYNSIISFVTKRCDELPDKARGELIAAVITDICRSLGTALFILLDNLEAEASAKELMKIVHTERGDMMGAATLFRCWNDHEDGREELLDEYKVELFVSITPATSLILKGAVESVLGVSKTRDISQDIKTH